MILHDANSPGTYDPLESENQVPPAEGKKVEFYREKKNSFSTEGVMTFMDVLAILLPNIENFYRNCSNLCDKEEKFKVY